MRKVLEMNEKREFSGLRVIAALTLTMSLAAFGCTTNKYPGNGEPGMGPMKTPTSTPGSSSGSIPMTMVSSYPDRPSSTDAIATLKANEAFRGKILGPASPAGGPLISESAQQVTGQYVSPTLFANPQFTVNSSISSTPVSAITSGAGGGGATAIAVPTVTTAASTTVIAPTAATASITSATPTAGTTVPVITTPLTNAATALTAAVATNRAATTGSTARTRAITSSSRTVLGSASVPIRIVRSSGSGVVVTNQSQPAVSLGVRRTTTTGAVTAPLVLPNNP